MMRRLHIVFSDRAAEQMEELHQFWRDSTGETPSADMLIQRALAEFHHTYVGSSAARRELARKATARSSAVNPAGSARQSRAS